MSVTGTVKDGVVVLPAGVVLPEGLQVVLTVPDAAAAPSFAERYAAYIGAAEDLPSDLSNSTRKSGSSAPVPSGSSAA